MWFTVIFLETEINVNSQRVIKGNEGSTVVRTLTVHQCGLSSNPRRDAICVLRMLFVLAFALRGFSPSSPVFPSPKKPTFPKFQFDPEWQTNNHFVDVLPLNRYLFFYC